MELKSWIVYDPGSGKCCITGTKPFELNLSEKCREDFDKYLADKYSLERGSYKLLDVVSNVNEFCKNTDYNIEIKTVENNRKSEFSDFEKVLINEIRPRPIRHVDDIENLLNPFI